jgi:hypothetical protein
MSKLVNETPKTLCGNQKVQEMLVIIWDVFILLRKFFLVFWSFFGTVVFITLLISTCSFHFSFLVLVCETFRTVFSVCTKLSPTLGC